MMISKINYIHQNPVKRGYVDDASHWRYSSARNYAGEKGLIEVREILVVSSVYIAFHIGRYGTRQKSTS